MKRQGFHCLRSSAPEAQSGAVVIVVMVLMMLAVLTALGTSRAQWLSERSAARRTCSARWRQPKP